VGSGVGSWESVARRIGQSRAEAAASSGTIYGVAQAKYKWGVPWMKVAKELEQACGGKPGPTSVLDKLTAMDADAVTSLYPKTGDRRDGAAKVIGNWKAGTAPNPRIGPVVVRLLEKELPAFRIEVDGRQYSAGQTLQNLLAEAHSAAAPEPQVVDVSESVQLLSHEGTLLEVGFVQQRFVLGRAPSEMVPAASVSTDGRLLAYQQGSRLHVADMNRLTAVPISWSAPVDLENCGSGTVLAVSCARPHGALLVLSSDTETWLCYAPANGPARKVSLLGSFNSAAAVLHGGIALLAAREQRQRKAECAMFPGMDVSAMYGAVSGGHALVMAIGRTHRGTVERWVSLDGGRPTQSEQGARVVLPLTGSAPPSLGGSVLAWPSPQLPLLAGWPGDPRSGMPSTA
jgi:hypothetical protein